MDIITFGSPCQDMSITGKRKGLDGARSGLFFDGISIIKEMREKTNGKYPRYYIVRRLTPIECARLQGFPDWWCMDLATEELGDDEIAFWREVFETHRVVAGTSGKAKADAQIIKWLKDSHSDSAEYKLWGNGVALPCVHFVLAGIVYYAQMPRFLL